MANTRLSGWLEDTAAGFAPQLLTDVRLRTTLSDESVILNSDDVIRILKKQPSPPTPEDTGSRFLRALKPTFIINSPALGPQVYAPYGVATRKEPALNKRRIKLSAALIALGLVGTGIVIGRLFR